MTKLSILLLAFLLSGCALPEWRVGQAKVPEPLTVTAEQREAWRQGADYVAKTVEGPVETVYVADELSSSLGAPERPLNDPDKAVRELREAYRNEVEARQELFARLEKLEGKAVEGTGVDLAPWGGGLGIVLIVAACIFIPGFASLLFFLFQRSATALRRVVKSVDRFEIENPQEAAKLKHHLSSELDAAHKLLIRKLKT